MKLLTSLCAMLFLPFLAVQADPLLVAVLMVKNEASVMHTTLQPLVDAGITDFLIYDTGSTDNTVQVTKDFFIHNNITNFVIEQGDWIDFSTSRNKALQLTEKNFPDATFMLMLDAEWILHNGQDLLNFCQQEQNSTTTLYQIHIHCLNEHQEIYDDLALPRLFRTKSNIYFIGKVHEIPDVEPQAVVPDKIYFVFNPTQQGKKKTEQRYLQDCKILAQQVQDHPNDFRSAFFLAQTYSSLQDFKNAITWYEHCLTLPGSTETFFITLCRLGQLYDFLGDSQKVIFNYVKAFAICPTRAESIIRLAQYLKNQHAYELSFLFAQQAINMDYPKNGAMSVEKWLYDFTRYEIASAVAAFVGEYEIGLQATQKALMVCPNSQNLQSRVALYQTMIQEQQDRKGMQ